MISIVEAMGDIVLPVVSDLFLPEEVLGLALLPDIAEDELMGCYEFLRLTVTVSKGKVLIFDILDPDDLDNPGDEMPRSATQHQQKLASDIQDAIAESAFAWGQLRQRDGRWRAGVL
jgi:hypothetical protein